MTSLLDRGIPVTLRRAEPQLSKDGNVKVAPTATPEVILASVQPISSTENDAQGTYTEERYRLRPARSVPEIPQGSLVEWNGAEWRISGPGVKHSGSPRTTYYEYVMVRN